RSRPRLDARREGFVCRRLGRPPPAPLFPYTTLFRSRYPETGRLGEDLESALALELDVTGRAHIVQHGRRDVGVDVERRSARRPRSEEHTSELQSRENLVCRLLLEEQNVGVLDGLPQV